MKALTVVGNKVFLPFTHRPGGVLVSASPVDFDTNDQVFSHRGTDGTCRSYHIASLQAFTGIAERITIALTQSDVYVVIRQYGIEIEHLERIQPTQLRQPGLMVSFDDGTDLIVDGNHRLVKRYQTGLREMYFFRFTEEQAKQAMIDVPDELIPALIDAARK
jgi:hypothetical protein